MKKLVICVVLCLWLSVDVQAQTPSADPEGGCCVERDLSGSFGQPEGSVFSQDCRARSFDTCAGFTFGSGRFVSYLGDDSVCVRVALVDVDNGGTTPSTSSPVCKCCPGNTVPVFVASSGGVFKYCTAPDVELSVFRGIGTVYSSVCEGETCTMLATDPADTNIVTAGDIPGANSACAVNQGDPSPTCDEASEVDCKVGSCCFLEPASDGPNYALTAGQQVLESKCLSMVRTKCDALGGVYGGTGSQCPTPNTVPGSFFAKGCPCCPEGTEFMIAALPSGAQRSLCVTPGVDLTSDATSDNYVEYAPVCNDADSTCDYVDISTQTSFDPTSNPGLGNTYNPQCAFGSTCNEGDFSCTSAPSDDVCLMPNSDGCKYLFFLFSHFLCSLFSLPRRQSVTTSVCVRRGLLLCSGVTNRSCCTPASLANK